MGWDSCYKKVVPYVFEIETPQGSGSGVFFMWNARKTYAAVGTAWHVICHADEWQQPIKLRHHETGKTVFLNADDRVVYRDRKRDTAAILIPRHHFKLPDVTLPMSDKDKFRSIGTEVGWVGYPAIVPQLCFFSGRVSAFDLSDDSYLIDGVAINGVSGGPVFTPGAGDVPELLGTVSAYLSNRSGANTPGLLKAQDVTPFHDAIDTIKSIDEERQKQEQEAKAQRNATQAAEPVPLPAKGAAAQPPNESPPRAATA